MSKFSTQIRHKLINAGFILLGERKESLSKESILIAVQESEGSKGKYYTFGRIYESGSYWQQGCESFSDKYEAIKAALRFFGMGV